MCRPATAESPTQVPLGAGLVGSHAGSQIASDSRCGVFFSHVHCVSPSACVRVCVCLSVLGNAKKGSIPLNGKESGAQNCWFWHWEVRLSEWSGPHPGLDFSPGLQDALNHFQLES